MVVSPLSQNMMVSNSATVNHIGVSGGELAKQLECMNNAFGLQREMMQHHERERDKDRAMFERVLAADREAARAEREESQKRLEKLLEKLAK